MAATQDIDRGSGRTLFGQSPSLYDEARPDYPERVYEVLTERCGLATDCKVFEVGAGTGQVTLRLAAAGAKVTAVEPDYELASLLMKKTENRLPNVNVHVAAFEDDVLPQSSFGLGVAATSFHWVDPAAGLPKVRRLLAPGGWWAMFWNVFMDADRPDPFHEATGRILAPLGRGPSAGASGRPPYSLDVELRTAELEEAGLRNVESEVIRWTATLDAVQTRALYSTFSSISRLPLEDRERVLDEIQAVAEDSFGGTVERPFQTALYTSQRA